MKKIIALVLVVVVVVLGIVFVPKLTHTCDSCGEFFVGAGYEPNVLVDYVSETEQIICKECALSQHAFMIQMGGATLDEFKRDIF